MRFISVVWQFARKQWIHNDCTVSLYLKRFFQRFRRSMKISVSFITYYCGMQYGVYNYIVKIIILSHLLSTSNILRKRITYFFRHNLTCFLNAFCIRRATFINGDMTPSNGELISQRLHHTSPVEMQLTAYLLEVYLCDATHCLPAEGVLVRCSDATEPWIT